jgi:uncharacterized protein with PIN domain
MARVRLRLHGALNDLLPPAQCGRTLAVELPGQPPLRHLVETLGVPHTEVARALAGDRPVGLDLGPPDDALLDLYPWSADCPQPLPGDGVRRFAADAHLGRLARKLRLLGFDTRFANDLGDAGLAAQAAAEGRVLLSRDRQLLMRADVRHGCYVPERPLFEQLAGLAVRFGLCEFARPFSRCMDCNGLLQSVTLEELDSLPPPGVVEMQDAYWRCDGCGKLYWRGTHWRALERQVEALCGPGSGGMSPG